MANWIADATSKHKGAFSAAAKRAGKSTSQFATEHEHDSGTLGRRARLAKTLMGMPKHALGDISQPDPEEERLRAMGLLPPAPPAEPTFGPGVPEMPTQDIEDDLPGMRLRMRDLPPQSARLTASPRPFVPPSPQMRIPRPVAPRAEAPLPTAIPRMPSADSVPPPMVSRQGMPPMPGVEDPGLPATVAQNAPVQTRPTPSEAFTRAQANLQSSADELGKQIPTWRKILGGVLSASHRTAGIGEQLAPNEMNRQAMRARYLDQIADNERQQQYMLAQVEARKQEAESHAEMRRATALSNKEREESARTKALTDAESKGFVALPQGQTVPEGRVPATINGVSGYYRAPEEMAEAKRTAEFNASAVRLTPEAAEELKVTNLGKKDPKTGELLFNKDVFNAAMQRAQHEADREGGKWEIKTATNDKGVVSVFRVNTVSGEVSAPKTVGPIGGTKPHPAIINDTGMSPKQQTVFNQIVGQYGKSKSIDASRKMHSYLATMDTAMKGKPNPQKDLMMVNAFAKLLDWGDSTVREGEVKMQLDVATYQQQIQSFLQKVSNGGLLAPDQRRNLYEAARNMMSAVNESAQKQEQAFAAQAKVNGLAQQWKDFRSEFQASYDEPGKGASPSGKKGDPLGIR